MSNRGGTWLIFILSVLVCAWDVYAAMRGQGHNYIAWILAALMAIVAVSALRKIVKG